MRLPCEVRELIVRLVVVEVADIDLGWVVGHAVEGDLDQPREDVCDALSSGVRRDVVPSVLFAELALRDLS